MKRFILPLVLALTLSAGCKPQTAPLVNAPAPSSDKLSLTSPWSNVTVKLLIPGSSGPTATKNQLLDVPAKLATYNHIFPILAIEDPYRLKTFVLDGSADFRDGHMPANGVFFISQRSGPVYCDLRSGFIQFGLAYIELPTSLGGLPAAIARFESGFDPANLKTIVSKKVDTQWIDYRTASPAYFFPTNPAAKPQITSYDFTDDILLLHARNPLTGEPATLWINLKTQQVTECVVNGRLQELPEGKPWAVQLKPP